MKKTKGMLHNTPAQYKEKYLWLKEVDSLALTNAQKKFRDCVMIIFSKILK